MVTKEDFKTEALELVGNIVSNVQKGRMFGKLYQTISSYYKNLIDTKQAFFDFGYISKDGKNYAIAGIFDIQTGEQIL